MANNLKVFNNYNDYETADLIKPAVSLVVSDNSVHYDPIEPTPPTPTFDGKWLATYQDGHTESAECNSTSISRNEINKTNLVSVEIGDCVRVINDSAFQSCSGLTSCTIGSGVTTIGNYAFRDCSGLTSVTIGSGVTSIGYYAFFGCSGLKSITMPKSITFIGSKAFQNCSGLTSIVIPSGVTSIGSNAFLSCISLTSITIEATTPPRLSGSNAFENTNNCPILVPSASLEAYKSADGWSTYSSRIQAIPNS